MSRPGQAVARQESVATASTSGLSCKALRKSCASETRAKVAITMKIQLEINWPPARIERRLVRFQAALLLIILALTITTNRLRADTGVCSGANVTLPFTDVMSSAFFCQIAAAYFSGLTNGTT